MFRLTNILIGLMVAIQMVAIVSAQDKGMLAGQILDSETGDPLFAACVFIQNGHQGAETDHEGYYWIPHVSPGRYSLLASRIGYTSVEGLEVEIAAGQTTELNIQLHDDPIYAKEEVTVTATRGNALVSEVPASVDIIDAATIKLQKPQNLAEVMQNIQGVNIKDYGGIGGIKSVSLRGSSSGQVLVMVDGQRINDAASGQVDFSRISVEGVEKIEIVRGGGSALYGADAIGGVINIITKKERSRESTSAAVDIMAGSFSSKSAKAIIRRSGEKYGGSFTYKILQTDGNFLYPHLYLDTLIEKKNNEFIAHDFFTSVQYTIGEKPLEHTIDLSHNYYFNDKGSPGSTSQPYDSARTTNRSNRLNLNIQGKLNLFNNYRLQGFLNDAVNTYKNNEMSVAVNDTHKSVATGVELQLTSILASNHTLIYGTGFRKNQSGGKGSSDELNSRTERFLFVQDEYFVHPDEMGYLRSISLLPAIRFDNYSDFGSHWSPKLGVVFNFGEIWRTSLKTNLGYNYKAPSFNDLYWPEDAFTVGNPDLVPEHGSDGDIGLRLRYPILNGIAIDLSYFRMQLTDLIIWQQGGAEGKWAPQNVSKALNQGIESSVTLKLIPDILNLSANYTHLDARNDDDEDRNSYQKYLVYRPKKTVNVNLDANWHQFTMGYSWQYVGYRYVNLANTVWLDPFQVSDIALGWHSYISGLDVDVTLKVKNLFDDLYEFVQYQPIPGREFRLSIGIGGNLIK